MNDCWRGKRIALTGRFASMDRPTARRLITGMGATVSERVTRKTSTLIIGSDGWPLKKAGKPTKNLRVAAKLKRRGYPLEIYSEAAFLEKLGVAHGEDSIHRLYTTEQISEMVQVSGLRLRRWIAAGLLSPKEVREGVALFSFRQVASIRHLWRLVASGCDTRMLLRNLQRISRLLPEETEVVGDIQRFGKALVTRAADGTLMDAYGQRLFCFDEDDPTDALSWAGAIDEQHDPDAAFAFAVRLESVSKDQAIEAYQAWVDRFGADPSALFNLGNLLAAAGQCREAVGHYQRAIEIDGGDAKLWNNLALTLARIGRLADASRALDVAIQRDPDYSDAYFNAADILEERGEASLARLMWKRYLAHDDRSEHAAYARSRCQLTVTSAVDDS